MQAQSPPSPGSTSPAHPLSLAVRRRIQRLAFLAGWLEAGVRELVEVLPQPAERDDGEVDPTAPNFRGRLEALLADEIGPACRELAALELAARRHSGRARRQQDEQEPTRERSPDDSDE